MMIAKRAVHVAGVGACAKGAVLADDEPLVLRHPASFDHVPDVPAVVEDDDVEEAG